MSYSIEQNGNRKAYGLQHFILDSPLDVANLPNTDIIPGSTAFCISNSASYMLNHEMKWREINLGGSGGSGSGLPSYTASDGGKFLGIVDGSAIWTNPNINNNANTEIFWINATMGENGIDLNGVTYQIVLEAVGAGKYPILNIMNIYYMPMTTVPNEDVGFEDFIFSTIGIGEPAGNLGALGMTLNNKNETNMFHVDFDQEPEKEIVYITVGVQENTNLSTSDVIKYDITYMTSGLDHLTDIRNEISNGKYAFAKIINGSEIWQVPFCNYGTNSVIFAGCNVSDPSEPPSDYVCLELNLTTPVTGIFTKYLNVNSGGSSTFVVEMTAGETEGSYVSTTTYGEAYSAVQTGKTVVFKFADLGFVNAISAVKMGESISFLFSANTNNSFTQGAATDTISISVV